MEFDLLLSGKCCAVASRLCCSAIKPSLPDALLPRAQVGVGIREGLDSSVHSLGSYIEENGERQLGLMLLQAGHEECL